MAEIHEERRRRPLRTRTLKGGRIVSDERNGAIECTVRNLSPHGALLQLPNVNGVPNDFDLYIDGETTPHPASTVWKRDGKMGVEFGLPPSAKAQLLAEAAFRCGVPTCRGVLAMDQHPFVQIDEGGVDNPSNFIALCPTCQEAYRRGIISTEALSTYKKILAALSSAFDIHTIDLLLFLASAPRDALIVSGDGVLTFVGLVSAGYAEVRMAAMNGKLLVNYAVNVTPKGRVLVEAWKSGNREAVRAALNVR